MKDVYSWREKCKEKKDSCATTNSCCVKPDPRFYYGRFGLTLVFVICVYFLLVVKHEISRSLRNQLLGGGRRKYTDCASADVDPSELYTIVVSTYNRDDPLIKNLDHWLSCPNVYQVQVVWHDPKRKPPKMLREMEKEFSCSNSVTPKLYVREQREDKLTNRFTIPAGGFVTPAVFNIDDDAVVDCHMMTVAFEQWKRMGVGSLVGFEPRLINWTMSTVGQGYTWYESCIDEVCSYNTLWPTKGAFLHRDYYSAFWNDEYRSARHLVDHYFTGEDILMTFVHFHSYYTKMTQAPPILSVQATSRYRRKYEDKSDRFTLLQKLIRLPSVLLYKAKILELSSLGARSSWNRGVVREGVSLLAEKMAKPILVPPATSTWLFVNTTSQNVIVDEPCQKDPRFFKLECSTQYSLHVLSNGEIAGLSLFSVVLVFTIFCLVRVIRWRLILYMRRSRKLTECSFNEKVEEHDALNYSHMSKARSKLYDSFHL